MHATNPSWLRATVSFWRSAFARTGTHFTIRLARSQISPPVSPPLPSPPIPAAMSSTSSGRRAPSTAAAAAASSPGQKRSRDEAGGGSPSDPDAAPAKNPRRAFASSPFADFGSYMAAKNSKLAAQFDADASTSGGLFTGVSIFVDGFTIPSSQVSAA